MAEKKKPKKVPQAKNSRVFSVSSQKLAGNAEGAKRPTAGDAGCEFFAMDGIMSRSPGWARATTSHPEGGRVPPFIEKLLFSEFLQTDFSALRRVLQSPTADLERAFEETLDAVCFALESGYKILAFGNGGSAADAEHLVAELVGRFGYDRNPLPAIAFTQPSPSITAIGNDYGYDRIFERHVRALGKPGDVAVGITTSGNSPNVLKALEVANEMGLVTIGLTGSRPAKIQDIARFVLRAPSGETPRIQEIHGLLIHSLCRGIEARLFPKDLPVLPAAKLVPGSELGKFSKAIEGRKSVFTNGCFDILHPGHVTLLREARSLGDFLIIGLNSDKSVKVLKGEGRPVHGFHDRALMLSSLEMVDFVIEFNEETPLKLIKKLSPEVLVKGGDYSRKTVVGAGWVEQHGGTVHIIPLVEGHSTTRILKNA